MLPLLAPCAAAAACTHVLPALIGCRMLLLCCAVQGVSLLGKLAYSYDLNAWTLLEGVTSARAHPNLMFWCAGLGAAQRCL